MTVTCVQLMFAIWCSLVPNLKCFALWIWLFKKLNY